MSYMVAGGVRIAMHALIAVTLLIGVFSGAMAAQDVGDQVARDLLVVHTWPDGTTLRSTPRDTAVSNMLRPYVDDARSVIEGFFDSPFPEPIAITVVPDRAAFSHVLRAEWGVPETACWMVATGVADFVVILSPRVWADEACEHDTSDSQHVRDIITHELVHSFHGQRHPSRNFDFDGAEAIGWFIEGLATYVAGQLDRDRLSSPEEALASGAVPARLEDAWSGQFRYGISGSMVRFIDETHGRATLVRLLPQTSEAGILNALKLTEDAFLTAWASWVPSR